MNLLILKDNRVDVLPEALLIPEFEAIWKRDKTIKKEYALRDFAYIYFLCDYNSVYQAYSKDTREDKIRKDLGKDRAMKISKECKVAIEKYKELQNTPSMRFLEAAKDALEAMTGYFKDVNFAERTKNGIPVYKATDVTRCLKDAGGVMKSIDDLREKVKKEIGEDTRIKGGGEAGLMEDPKSL